MNAVEDLTPKVRDWSGYKDVLPLAWETVTVKKRILSFPCVVTNDGVYWRTDRAKEYGAKPPKDDWNFDDFLAYAKTMTKADKNQYGFGMRGQGTWAVLYATEFMYANGAQVLNKDGKGVINSKEAAEALDWYLDLFRKHKVCPPSVPTDGWRGIVGGCGPAEVVQGPGAGRVGQVGCVRDRGPVPGPRRLGRQARLGGRAPLPAGAGRQARLAGVPREVRRHADEEHGLMPSSPATVAA